MKCRLIPAENTAQYVRINTYMRKLQFNWCYCSSPVQSYYYLFWFSYNLNNFIFINVFKTVKEFSSFFHGDVHISLNSWCLLIDRLFRTCCCWFVRLLENNWAQHQVFLNENISDMHYLKTKTKIIEIFLSFLFLFPFSLAF